MARMGEMIFTGYIPGKGTVRVHQDLDNPKFVFAYSDHSEYPYYMNRARVQPRKNNNSANAENRTQNVVIHSQPTLW